MHQDAVCELSESMQLLGALHGNTADLATIALRSSGRQIAAARLARMSVQMAVHEQTSTVSPQLVP